MRDASDFDTRNVLGMLEEEALPQVMEGSQTIGWLHLLHLGRIHNLRFHRPVAVLVIILPFRTHSRVDGQNL